MIFPKNQPGSQVTGGKRRSQTPAKNTSNPLFLQGPVILRVGQTVLKSYTGFEQVRVSLTLT